MVMFMKSPRGNVLPLNNNNNNDNDNDNDSAISTIQKEYPINYRFNVL